MPQSRQAGCYDAAGALDYTPGAIFAEFPGCVCSFEIQRCSELVCACEDNTFMRHVVSSVLEFGKLGVTSKVDGNERLTRNQKGKQ